MGWETETVLAGGRKGGWSGRAGSLELEGRDETNDCESGLYYYVGSAVDVGMESKTRVLSPSPDGGLLPSLR